MTIQNNKIKKLLHISDIHVRLYHRNKEYLNVLQYTKKFYEDLENKQEYLTVITGDLFHSKTELSPQSVDIVHQFLKTISEYTPVIVISGNHDANLSNENRLDSISPIIEMIDSQRVLYYKDTGWYKYNNLDFYVCSVFDQKLPPKDYKYPENSICLYHGMIQNTKIGNNFMLSKQNNFTIKDFEKFQFVLLGDIHLYQILSTSKPLMAYAGSFVQSNYGEKETGHGILVWDLENKSLQFNEIQNDYTCYNVIVQNGKIIEKADIKAKYPKIKIKHKNTTSQQLQKIKKQIKKKHKPYQLTFFTQNDQFKIQQSAQMAYEIKNIGDVLYQKTLFEQYNDRTSIATNQEMVQLLKLNSIYNKELKKKQINLEPTHCRLKSLQFSNFFSYGENNFINLQDKQGLIGIIGSNAIGKTSIINILLFMMFDNTPYTTKTISLLNTNKDFLYGKLQLYINQQLYVIEKIGKRKKLKGVCHLPIEINFYRVEGDQLINLSGKQRFDTRKIMTTLLGQFSNIITTNVATQGNNTSFIDLKNTARKQFLNNLLNLNIFDQLFTIANDEYKVLNAQIVLYDHNQIQQDKSKVQQEICYYGKQIDDLENSLKKQGIQIEEKEKEITDTIQRFKNIDIELENYSIEKINKEIERLKSQFNSIIEKGQIDNEELVKIETGIKTNTQSLVSYDIEQLNKRLDFLTEEIQFYNGLMLQGSTLQVRIEQSSKKLQLLKKVEYDQNCPYCMNNPLTKDALQVQKGYKDSIMKLDELCKKMDSKQYAMQQYKEIKIKIQEYDKINKKLLSLRNDKNLKEKQINSSIVRLQSLQVQIKNKEDLIKKLTKNKKAIQFNKENKLSLQKLKQEKKGLQTESKKTNQSLNNYKVKIKINEDKLDQYIIKLQKYKEISNKIQIVQKYKEFVNKNGIQYYIIKNIIQILEHQVNNVLQLITNFTTEFVLDGKNIQIQVRGQQLSHNVDTCSGFERFIISLAMRYSLSKITNLCSYDFFVVDEGFGVMDALNLGELENVLRFLQDKFRHVIVVSHIDIVKGLLQNFINVQKDLNNYGYSKVKQN